MKILICGNVYPPNFIGGAELIAHYQGMALAKAGHQVQVFSGDIAPGFPRHEIREDFYDGLKIHRVTLWPEDYQSEFVNFAHQDIEKAFLAILNKFKPDVVHCHNLVGLSVVIIRMAKEFGARVIVTLHDHWGYCFRNTSMKPDGASCVDSSRCFECQPYIGDGSNRRIPIKMRQDYLSLAMQDVDYFVSPSDYLAKAYVAAGFPSARMRVIWNGVDYARFSKLRKVRSERIRFSYFGHFGRHKGVHVLLDAIGRLPAAARRQITVNLVGDGEERRSYEQQLEDSGCGHIVKFWGKLDNKKVDLAYSETDVLVIPSIWRENQPVSITEAMAVGIPVIASNMGGMPEMVIDGQNGYVFEAGDSVGLAEKIQAIIYNPETIVELGVAAQASMRLNSFEISANRLIDLYKAERGPVHLHPAKSPPVVVCIGGNVGEKVADGIVLLSHYLGGQLHVVMAEWLTDIQKEQAIVILAANDQVELEDVAIWQRKLGLPVLVPGARGDLVEFVKEKRCGLYYDDGHEMAACLVYLADNGLTMSAS